MSRVSHQASAYPAARWSTTLGGRAVFASTSSKPALLRTYLRDASQMFDGRPPPIVCTATLDSSTEHPSLTSQTLLTGFSSDSFVSDGGTSDAGKTIRLAPPHPEILYRKPRPTYARRRVVIDDDMLGDWQERTLTTVALDNPLDPNGYYRLHFPLLLQLSSRNRIKSSVFSYRRRPSTKMKNIDTFFETLGQLNDDSDEEFEIASTITCVSDTSLHALPVDNESMYDDSRHAET